MLKMFEMKLRRWEKICRQFIARRDCAGLELAQEQLAYARQNLIDFAEMEGIDKRMYKL